MKYLVLLAVLAVVYAIWRSQRPLPPRPPAPPHIQPPEPMVRCAHCGVHLPQSQALQHDGRSYCCEAHRRAG
ncbi:uncharacterized protein SAMN05428957_103371 [Oryzisolibacter propanilivorax]|uniref:Uncharacterized protein n=1 Tax=Oryzisolibacter propanilivorax TaxID=1527607 RepID=A0A1G9RMW8_9BURK|nr:PP0621 family protein [Oryzisolibacter propanilivorax]SDM24420.1 uncharacterized protein SAMN05428957_103371 [Oryzisolibacter propanilivorax]